MRRQSSEEWPSWRLFAGAAIAWSLLGGFASGALLFAARWIGRGELGTPALAVVHGRVQVFGFVLLMTIGVLYWFLPRLWGVPAAPGTHPGAALGLFTSGAILAVVGHLAEFGPVVTVAAALETGGAVVVMRDILGLLRRRAEPGKGDDPALLAALGSAALALPSAFVVQGLAPTGLLPIGLALSFSLAFHGVLVPIALAMSARLFPLYFRTRLPVRRVLAAALAVNAAGLAIRTWGLARDWAVGVRFGSVLEGAAILAAIGALQLLAPRQRRPAAARVLWRDPTTYLVHAAYCCLGCDAVLLMWAGVVGATVAGTLEWHLVGVGYLTGLILGVGTHLLPGFARRRQCSERAAWGIFVGYLAMTALRLVAAVVAGTRAAPAGTAAGIVGLVTLTVFAWNSRILDAANREHRREPTC
ncbi:MAG: NnrS family protein [Thermomicrobium sp.]|nr:NnrS family protein [Thermomicrobium sp.]